MPAAVPPRLKLAFIYVALAALTWTVFAGTIDFGFLDYDDPNYVSQNREVQAGLSWDGAKHAFTAAHARNWHPLTTLSHMLDCQLFGLDPAGPHFVNVVLHLATTLLLFSFLRGTTGSCWRSAFVAAVFAIHPLRVESVAWISERKDVLSASFFMLTLVAYARYAQKPGGIRYLLVALTFTLGLLSKPMLVTLPLLLLLLDYWPLGRWENNGTRWSVARGPILLEKLPLCFLSAICAGATLVAQRSTVAYTEAVPIAARTGNAVVSYVAYLGQMLWPAKLAVFYPYTAGQLAWWQLALAGLCLAVITAGAIALRRRLPFIFLGWFWYLVALLPVIGLVQVGLQARADRYTYLPQVGLIIAITWTISALAGARSRRRQTVLGGLAVAVTVALAVCASIQTATWKDTESLWRHALAVTKNNDVAHYNVALQLSNRGEIGRAIWYFQQALAVQTAQGETRRQLSPAVLHNALGNALRQAGRKLDALEQYQKAVALRDDFADAQANLATLLAEHGETEAAIAHYEKALMIPPEDPAYHLAFAAVLAEAGRPVEAEAHFHRAREMIEAAKTLANAR